MWTHETRSASTQRKWPFRGSRMGLAFYKCSVVNQWHLQVGCSSWQRGSTHRSRRNVSPHSLAWSVTSNTCSLRNSSCGLNKSPWSFLCRKPLTSAPKRLERPFITTSAVSRFCEICHKPGKVILLVITLSKAYMKDCDLFLARVEVESISAYHFLSVPDHCLKQISRERRLVTPTLQSLNKTVLEGFPVAKNTSDPSHSKRASSISVSRRSNIT